MPGFRHIIILFLKHNTLTLDLVLSSPWNIFSWISSSLKFSHLAGLNSKSFLQKIFFQSIHNDLKFISIIWIFVHNYISNPSLIPSPIYVIYVSNLSQIYFPEDYNMLQKRNSCISVPQCITTRTVPVWHLENAR